MNEKYSQILCIAATVFGLVFIGFLYISEPRSLAEVSTKGKVALGTYEVDKAAFDQGLDSFNRDEFMAARADFARADPEKRDAITLFYFAYSYYRQGWGRFSNDDDLFKLGVSTVDQLIAIEPNFKTTDETLGLKTPYELKAEMEEGLKITASDFNPLKLTRERK